MRIRPALLVLFLITAGAGALAALGRRQAPATKPDAEGPDAAAADADAGAPDGLPRLVVPTGGSIPHGSEASRGAEQEMLLGIGRQVIGRARTADLRMQEATLSLEHAELEVHADGVVVLRDLGSENGVRVDGVPVVEAELHDGNRIQLGDVLLVFKSDLEAGSSGREGGEFG